MNLRLLAAASMLALATQAGATSFVVTTDWLSDMTGSTSDATSSSTKDDDKIVRAAKDDAASFVASQGQIRGAHLEAAVTLIRGKQPQLQASDMQLAEAILAY